MVIIIIEDARLHGNLKYFLLLLMCVREQNLYMLVKNVKFMPVDFTTAICVDSVEELPSLGFCDGYGSLLEHFYEFDERLCASTIM